VILGIGVGIAKIGLLGTMLRVKNHLLVRNAMSVYLRRVEVSAREGCDLLGGGRI